MHTVEYLLFRELQITLVLVGLQSSNWSAMLRHSLIPPLGLHTLPLPEPESSLYQMLNVSSIQSWWPLCVLKSTHMKQTTLRQYGIGVELVTIVACQSLSVVSTITIS